MHAYSILAVRQGIFKCDIINIVKHVPAGVKLFTGTRCAKIRTTKNYGERRVVHIVDKGELKKDRV